MPTNARTYCSRGNPKLIATADTAVAHTGLLTERQQLAQAEKNRTSRGLSPQQGGKHDA